MADNEVTQADIDAANAFWGEQIKKVMEPEKHGKSAFADCGGPIEDNALVQAFARHRIQSAPPVRADVVEAYASLRVLAAAHLVDHPNIDRQRQLAALPPSAALRTNQAPTDAPEAAPVQRKVEYIGHPELGTPDMDTAKIARGADRGAEAGGDGV